MKIVADENMPGLEQLPDDVQLLRLPGRQLGPAQVADADALLVRSVTRVDRALLAGSTVSFVGSATIGTDHLDLHWLQSAGIRTAWAPGCNAMAVAEYVLQAVLAWLLERGETPVGLTVGLLGAGNVGARVGWLLEALGCQVRFSDPPREQAGEAAPVGQWASVDELLGSRVLSLHVPLVTGGPWATAGFIDRQRLARFGPDQLLINTCRGAVVDNQALLARLQAAGPPQVVLDVWENEPRILAPLCRRVRLATPHIAGYTVQGKRRGTAMVLAALAEAAGRGWRLPWPSGPQRQLHSRVLTAADLLALLRSEYQPERDGQALAASLAAADPGLAFDGLRREYPERHELGGSSVAAVSDDLAAVLRRLGVGWGREPASSDPAAQWLAGSCSR